MSSMVVSFTDFQVDADFCVGKSKIEGFWIINMNYFNDR